MMIGVIESVLSGQAKRYHAAIVREHVQKSILRGLVRAYAMPVISFHGGTCLRLAHGIGRYSEDLDFALDGDADYYDFPKWLDKTARYLRREGYEPRIKMKKARSAVEKAEVHFPGLLHRVGVSPHKDQNLRIKLEVDTRPPEGAVSERCKGHTTAVPEGRLYLWCHNLPSLMAGKMAAILTRRYSKGRDLIDLRWFLRESPATQPNMDMLNNALAQSGWNGPSLSLADWREHIQTRLQGMDWEKVRTEAKTFAIDPETDDPLTLESLQTDLL